MDNECVIPVINPVLWIWSSVQARKALPQLLWRADLIYKLCVTENQQMLVRWHQFLIFEVCFWRFWEQKQGGLNEHKVLLHSGFRSLEREANQMELSTDRLRFGSGLTVGMAPWDLINSAMKSLLNTGFLDGRTLVKEEILYTVWLPFNPRIWGSISMKVNSSL